MNISRLARRVGLAFVLLLAPLSIPGRASHINLPPETPAILDKIYSFDLQGGIEASKRLPQERANHPLGYLLEAEAWWWRIWCTSADFKYGMSDGRFFFQAEDGIRYLTVTGVQTCALPI